MADNLCPNCGNILSFYNGSLGYEALVCRKCGWFSDVLGEVGIDELYITNKRLEYVL